MDKNFDLYCACSLMVETTKYLGNHDRDFCKVLLDKTTEYMKQIKIDEDLINEVKKHGEELERRLKEQNPEV